MNPTFELNVSLLLAEAAYDAAESVPLKLPEGYAHVSDIVVDYGTLKDHVAEASPGQHKLFRAMLSHALLPNVFGIVAKSSDGTCAVAFRGTQHPDEWLADFDFLHEAYKYAPGFGSVHQGFQRVYDTIRPSVLSGLAACGPRKRTLIIGHSLGAALAILCAPDVANLGPSDYPVPEVHNFAGPRAAAPDSPLRSTFAFMFNRTIPTCIRLVNHWDIVPHLAPSITMYEHVGEGVGVDGGFTLDLHRAHSLGLSYGPGLLSLVPQAPDAMHVASVK
jgi:triacylglycerol lipase